MTLTNREGFICNFLSALSLLFISIENIEWTFCDFLLFFLECVHMWTTGRVAASSVAACGRLNEKHQTFHL